MLNITSAKQEVVRRKLLPRCRAMKIALFFFSVLDWALLHRLEPVPRLVNTADILQLFSQVYSDDFQTFTQGTRHMKDNQLHWRSGSDFSCVFLFVALVILAASRDLSAVGKIDAFTT